MMIDTRYPDGTVTRGPSIDDPSLDEPTQLSDALDAFLADHGTTRAAREAGRDWYVRNATVGIPSTMGRSVPQSSGRQAYPAPNGNVGVVDTPEYVDHLTRLLRTERDRQGQEAAHGDDRGFLWSLFGAADRGRAL